MDPCTDFMTKFMEKTEFTQKICESVKPKLSDILNDFYLFDLDLTS